MSKNKKQEEVLEQKVITNPFDYGYKPGTLVTMDANLFATMMQYIGATAQEEIKTMVVVNQFPLKTGPVKDENGMTTMPEEQVMFTISEKGKRAEELFNECIELHIENINKGLAVESPEQSQLNLGE